jgi:hypothetical protein
MEQQNKRRRLESTQSHFRHLQQPQLQLQQPMVPVPPWIPQNMWNKMRTEVDDTLKNFTSVYDIDVIMETFNIRQQKTSEICFVCGCQRHLVRHSLESLFVAYWTIRF